VDATRFPSIGGVSKKLMDRNSKTGMSFASIPASATMVDSPDLPLLSEIELIQPQTEPIQPQVEPIQTQVENAQLTCHHTIPGLQADSFPPSFIVKDSWPLRLNEFDMYMAAPGVPDVICCFPVKGPNGKD
jgi:hypothetical protein